MLSQFYTNIEVIWLISRRFINLSSISLYVYSLILRVKLCLLTIEHFEIANSGTLDLAVEILFILKCKIRSTFMQQNVYFSKFMPIGFSKSLKALC